MSLPRDELWKVLVDTVHALPMYKNHKRYVEDSMIKEKPDISAQELAVQLNIALGEALVMLDEIRGSTTELKIGIPGASSSKPSARTLLDFDTNSG
jgi:hypothetical protein